MTAAAEQSGAGRSRKRKTVPRSYRAPGRPLRPGHLHREQDRERGPPAAAARGGARSAARREL